MSIHIAKVGIIGSGTMGTGIAAQIAAAGVPVCLLDVVPAALSEEEQKAGLTTESRVFRNRIPLQAMKQIKNPRSGIGYTADMCNRITIGNLEDDLELLSDCDWVIEVIIEKLAIKKDLIRKIYPYLKRTAIVSSNTSGVSIAEIAADMPEEFKSRFLGTHFFNPPRFMKLLELIPGDGTSEEIYSYVKYFGEHILGKEIVNAKDTPNFIANRVGVYSSVIALQLMQKYGFDFEKVDRLTGKEMMRPKSAVFKTIDMVGLDVLYNIAENLVNTLSDPEEIKTFTLPEFYGDMVRAGKLGNKTGEGFYKTVKTASGKEKMVWDPETGDYKPLLKEKILLVEEAGRQKSRAGKLKTLIQGNCPESEFAWEVVKKTLLYAAGRIPEIADDYKEVDKGLRYGYNWEIGPFEIWDEIGVKDSVKRMQREGDEVPQWVLDRLAAGQEEFYGKSEKSAEQETDAVIKKQDYSMLVDMGDGVIGFQICARGNAINFGLMDELQDAIRKMNEDPDWKGLVLMNGSSNFCNGADLVTILEMIEKDDMEGVGRGIDRFHQTSMMLKYAKKPVVAAVQGMVLGGGLEFAMHCHRVVAHVESYMGLVEAGVGLVPGGGGIKELLMRHMNRIKGVALTDLNPVIQKVWETVATAKVSSNAFDAKEMGFLRENDRIVMNGNEVWQAAKEEVIRMAGDGFRQSMPADIQVNGISGKAYLDYIISMMRSGKMITEYDSVIADVVARIVTGGNLPKKAVISEGQMLELERAAFLELAARRETRERIRYMLTKGKPLRN